MLVLLVSAAMAQDPLQVAADAAPLPAYLDAEQIREALGGGDWQSCADALQVTSATGQLAFTVAGNGAIEGVQWAGLEAPLAACWSEVLAGVSLPGHDESPLAVGWTVAVREGIVYPYPVVQLSARVLAPLFLFVAPDATPAQREALRGALGFSADGSAGRAP